MINRTCNCFYFWHCFLMLPPHLLECMLLWTSTVMNIVIPEKMSTRLLKEITMTLISLFHRLQGKENLPWNLTFHDKFDFFFLSCFFSSPCWSCCIINLKKLLIVISRIFPHSVWARFYIHIFAKELNLLPHPLVIGLLSFLLGVCGRGGDAGTHWTFSV